MERSFGACGLQGCLSERSRLLKEKLFTCCNGSGVAKCRVFRVRLLAATLHLSFVNILR